MTRLNLRAQTAVIQAMQLGRWASHTPQKTTTAARRARAAMAAGCCALAFGRRSVPLAGCARLAANRAREGRKTNGLIGQALSRRYNKINNFWLRLPYPAAAQSVSHRLKTLRY